MFGPINPVQVGNWYRMTNEAAFEVVALDVDQETIAIQYFDGSLGEFDFDTWVTLPLLSIAPPDDWSGVMDMESVDFLPDEATASAFFTEDPLNLIDYLNRTMPD